jgi:hypothetical protein
LEYHIQQEEIKTCIEKLYHAFLLAEEEMVGENNTSFDTNNLTANILQNNTEFPTSHQ